jgi:Protein of unknown function (DUF4236)
MGFYIRKALRVGPLRFNLSKSGIGMSAGVRGLRFGTGPRGNYVHMGRGGLYFRQSLGSPSRPRPASMEPALLPPQSPASVGALEDIESGSVLEMVDGSSADLIRELNEKRKKMRFLPGSIGISVGIFILLVAGDSPAWLVAVCVAASACLCWMASAQDALRKTTVIFYNLEPDIESSYQRLHDALSQLRSCGRAWHIEARGDVRDRKYHGGAGAVVMRKPITVKSGQPPLVKTNIEVPLIPAGRQTLAFMPDRLLVFEPAAVGAVSYRDLSMERVETRFIEEETLTQDATVVDKTWRYVNKKGGSDRRFKNNRELPVCLYDQLHFSSASGLNEVVQLSRKGAGDPLAIALGGMRELTVTESDRGTPNP